jgi:succinate-acetate transporter protein
MTTSPFGEGGAEGAAYNSSQCFHNITMALCSFVFMIGTLRVNVPFVLTFLGLVGLFSFIAAADAAVPHAATAADLAHIEMLLKCAGGFGFLGLICGWYAFMLPRWCQVRIMSDSLSQVPCHP